MNPSGSVVFLTHKNFDFIGMRKREGMQKNLHWIWLILNLRVSA
jgi:hypothetical protein